MGFRKDITRELGEIRKDIRGLAAAREAAAGIAATAAAVADVHAAAREAGNEAVAARNAASEHVSVVRDGLHEVTQKLDDVMKRLPLRAVEAKPDTPKRGTKTTA